MIHEELFYKRQFALEASLSVIDGHELSDSLRKLFQL